MTNKTDVYLNHVGVVCALGYGLDELKKNLTLDGADTLMTWTDEYGTASVPVGKYTGPLPEIPFVDTRWHSRNNQLALAAYEQIQEQVNQALEQYGAGRVGVVIGTSTSGIGDAEEAIRHYVEHDMLPDNYHYAVQEMGNTAHFIAKMANVAGPVYAISTACSSGAKALASARRLITAGICDVVIAGGVDSLCKLTLQGFTALEAVSDEVCQPFSVNRNGINVGEAGALFVLSRHKHGVCLSGIGESSDAYHLSAPEPAGKGAETCMELALQDAGLGADDIDYINLHGTATLLNDKMESLAVSRLFPKSVLCSSTKALTGHTLGAAGALEAAICWLALTQKKLAPNHVWDEQADPELPRLNFVGRDTQMTTLNTVLTNSFAFGGNNIALVMGRVR